MGHEVNISHPCVGERVIHYKKGDLLLDNKAFDHLIDKAIHIVVDKNKRERDSMPIHIKVSQMWN